MRDVADPGVWVPVRFPQGQSADSAEEGVERLAEGPAGRGSKSTRGLLTGEGLCDERGGRDGAGAGPQGRSSVDKIPSAAGFVGTIAHEGGLGDGESAERAARSPVSASSHAVQRPPWCPAMTWTTGTGQRVDRWPIMPRPRCGSRVDERVDLRERVRGRLPLLLAAFDQNCLNA
jgi:hypothetical protein